VTASEALVAGRSAPLLLALAAGSKELAAFESFERRGARAQTKKGLQTGRELKGNFYICCLLCDFAGYQLYIY
jgi:hypothetical protein